jgi:hypothetical protein
MVVQFVGAPEALLFFMLMAADAAQTRYLKGKIEANNQDINQVRERAARLEGTYIKADGGPPSTKSED